jgi:hypothetical protein
VTRRVLLAALALAGPAAGTLIVLDFLARPRDVWAALLLVVGGLAGSALERGRAR